MKTFDYKKLTKEELEEIFIDFSFEISPMWHQLCSLAFAADRDRIAFLHGVGTGKTLTALWSTQLWNNKKILVVCPSSAFSSWERDITKYTDYSYTFLTGSGKERRSKLEKEENIYIINYEGLKTIYAKLKKGCGWIIVKDLFIHNFDCIIFDEVHKCKSYKSLQSKICYQLSKETPNIIGLTGTAVDKSLLELFNIYKVIDLGESLGTNFFNYRMKYFRPPSWGYEWKPKLNSKEKILNKISNCTLSFDREECFDLPKLQEIIREIPSTPEFLDLQNKIINGKIITLDGVDIETSIDSNDPKDVQAFRVLRSNFLRELPTGFVYYSCEEEKRTFRLKRNPKIESLLDLLEDTSGKVVIFYHYTEEGKMIEEALKYNKYKYITIKGGQKGKERKDNVNKFIENKSITCAVVQQSAGSEGWDGYVASVAIFFSPIASPKMRKQCIGRIHRKGQEKSCLAIDLVLKNSFDERVIKNRSERFNFVQETMKYIQEKGGVEEI